MPNTDQIIEGLLDKVVNCEDDNQAAKKIAWKTQDGKTATVEIVDGRYGVTAKASVDNTFFGEGPVEPLRTPQTRGAVTAVSRVGKLGLTAEHDAQVRAAIAAVTAARKATEPEGLAILRAAFDKEEKYRVDLDRSFDDENGSAHRPRPPSTDLDALCAKYPRAALWLRSEAFTNASNYRKSGAGFEALAALRSGADLSAVKKILSDWSSE